MIKILLLNLGCKLSIFKLLIKNNYFIIEFKKKLNKQIILNIDGLFLSNGSGNPINYLKYKNLILFALINKIPIMSICLGHQILSILNKLKIFKLKLGHHGVNHPIFNCSNKKIFITSQNHNYNVKSLKKKKIINLFFSLFDYTLQSFSSINQPFISLQGHPEGGAGPNDLNFFFNFFFKFYK